MVNVRCTIINIYVRIYTNVLWCPNDTEMFEFIGPIKCLSAIFCRVCVYGELFFFLPLHYMRIIIGIDLTSIGVKAGISI